MSAQMRLTRVKLVDIAEAAGVSLATVDRVINGRKGVRPQTVQQVIDAAQQLHYPLIAPNGAAREPVFDFILPGGTNTFLAQLAQELEATAAKTPLPGHTVRCRRIEGFDPKAYADALRAAAEDSDGIGFIALDHPLVREAADAVMAGGVPVVTLVSDLTHSKRHAYVGVDNRAAGWSAGYLLGRFLGGRGGSVGLIAGSLSYRGHEEREMGFRHVMREDFPHLAVIGPREGHDEVERNRLVAREIIDTTPDLVGIYNIGGGTRGVGEALKETDRAGKVVFIGHELTPYTRTFLLDGTMDAVIHQDARAEAQAAVRALTAAHRGAEIAVEPTRIEIFIRGNLP
jgi:LacI family transcriptional regulator